MTGSLVCPGVFGLSSVATIDLLPYVPTF
jgi:hypothetical protein